MKFGETYEYHKIPEWYNDYLNYAALKSKIDKDKEQIKQQHMIKLPGYYMFLSNSRRLMSLACQLQRKNESLSDLIPKEREDSHNGLVEDQSDLVPKIFMRKIPNVASIQQLGDIKLKNGETPKSEVLSSLPTID